MLDDRSYRAGSGGAPVPPERARELLTNATPEQLHRVGKRLTAYSPNSGTGEFLPYGPTFGTEYRRRTPTRPPATATPTAYR